MQERTLEGITVISEDGLPQSNSNLLVKEIL